MTASDQPHPPPPPPAPSPPRLHLLAASPTLAILSSPHSLHIHPPAIPPPPLGSAATLAALHPTHDPPLLALATASKTLHLFHLRRAPAPATTTNTTTTTWAPVYTHRLAKRPTALHFTPHHGLLVSDALGAVYHLPLTAPTSPPVNPSPPPLLAHCASITALALSPHPPHLLATADRAAKLRLSHFPRAYIIHGFAMPHKPLVSLLHWVSPALLISAATGGHLVLWRVNHHPPPPTSHDDSAGNKAHDTHETPVAPIAEARLPPCNPAPAFLPTALVPIQQPRQQQQQQQQRALSQHRFLVTTDAPHGPFVVSITEEMGLNVEAVAAEQVLSPVETAAWCGGRLWLEPLGRRPLECRVVEGRDGWAIERGPAIDVSGGGVESELGAGKSEQGGDKTDQKDGAAGAREDALTRVMWLRAQAQKDMVPNWKGKKRKWQSQRTGQES